MAPTCTTSPPSTTPPLPEADRTPAAEAEARANDVRRHIVRLEEVDSTMDEALLRAEAGAAHGTLVVARSQRRGRGRTGSAWRSPAESGLYFTLVAYVHAGPALAAVAPALGLACTDALRGQGLPVTVKWPNDLWCARRKLGGLLVQRESCGPTGCCLLVGVGLNLTPVPDAPKGATGDAAEGAPFAVPPTDVASVWQATGRSGPRPTADGLLAALQDALLAQLDRWQREGFAPQMAAYDALHALHGQTVRGQGPSGAAVEGRCLGVAANGSLRIACPTAGGVTEVAIAAGAIRHVRPVT